MNAGALAAREKNKIYHTHSDEEREMRFSIAEHFLEYGILEECRTCQHQCKQWNARPVGLALFVCMWRKNGKTNY